MSQLLNKSAGNVKFLLEKNIKVKEPFGLLREWLMTAQKNSDIPEPNCGSLATVSKEGYAANRVAAIKDIKNDGVTFFTNYGSRKALEIANNPNVAMTIYWYPLMRSVRLEGVAEKISAEESLICFHQMPRSYQIGAIASEQSTPIHSRECLDRLEWGLLATLGPDAEVPIPNWGGYLLKPRMVEFWQGHKKHLPDRICFRRDAGLDRKVDLKLLHNGVDGWVYERLAP